MPAATVERFGRTRARARQRRRDTDLVPAPFARATAAAFSQQAATFLRLIFRRTTTAAVDLFRSQASRPAACIAV